MLRFRTSTPWPRSLLASVIRGAALFLALGLLPVQAQAESATASVPTSLLSDSAQLRAWVSEHNKTLAAARAQVRKSEADIATARLLPNPELDVGVDGLSVGAPTPKTLNYGDTLAIHAQLAQTFELGKRSPRVGAATHRKLASQASYEAMLGQKINEARDSLAQVAHLQARQAILKQRLAQAQEVTTLADTRLAHGDISGTDHDRLVLEEASIQREDADNSADLADSQAMCAAILGATCNEQLSLDQLDAAAALPGNLEQLVPRARQTPIIRSLKEQQAAAGFDAQLWRARAIPDPTLGVGYTRDFYTWAGSQPHTLGVNLAIPLPVFDTGTSQAQAAQSEAESLAAEAEATASYGQGTINGLLARRAQLSRKLQVISAELLPRSDAVVKSAEAAYQQGQLSMTDLVLVKRDHLALRLDEIDTRYALFSVRNELRLALALETIN